MKFSVHHIQTSPKTKPVREDTSRMPHLPSLRALSLPNASLPAHTDFPFHTPLPLTSEEAQALLRPGPNSAYKARHYICQRGDLHGQNRD